MEFISAACLFSLSIFCFYKHYRFTQRYKIYVERR